MEYKLLALDIDGTVLNSRSTLTPRTKAAILRAIQGGVRVVLATGRRLTNTLPLANILGLTELVVVHNGVVVYDPALGQSIYQGGVDLALAQEIVDKLDSVSMNYVVYTGESAGERVVAPLGSWRAPEDLLTYYLGEKAQFVDKIKLDSPPIRISLIDRAAKVDRFFDELAKNYDGGQIHHMLFGTERNIWRGIEIIPADCNKGTGLRFVAERLGIDASEVVAIGDNINDLEMIRWAGQGVAMANGSELLKTQAKRIAPSNDHDGVAQIIEELLL
ncbi:MAG TPA: hypothetical protein DDW87_03675 [Firmicutes bacterium]|nr:hypothetical protein [Bacillota bacterium]